MDVNDTKEKFEDYNKIADEIFKSETEDDIERENNHSIEKETNSMNSNKENDRNDYIIYSEIYNNNILMSDILFNFLLYFYNLGVNCFFNCGLQLIIHSYRFIIYLIDVINHNMNKNVYQTNNVSISFIEFCSFAD